MHFIKMFTEKIFQILQNTETVFKNQNINFYCQSDSDSSGFILSLYTSLFCWSLSKITGNFSWVDRLWSILPSIFSFHYVFHRNFCENKDFNLRQIIMIILTTLWSIRLTYNFFRKGGYQPGGEDYRWQIVKKKYQQCISLGNVKFIFYFLYTKYFVIFNFFTNFFICR